ncbi:hypothetical protein [Bifidobacterium pullorum]|uniref:hypothetical protein n=1 Tax=Bifidobacterium pullorum TaxID=78448 RepID=UPI0024AE4DDB|nr:hypothetical protein [Bifidobacterium pullorum]
MEPFTFPATFPYASTTLTVDSLGVNLDVEVRVYDTLNDMRRDATLYYVYEAPDSDDYPVKDANFKDSLGVTMPGRLFDRGKSRIPDYADSPHCVVFISKESLTLEILAHELTHAAMFLNNAYHDRKERIRIGNETVPYMVGSMLTQCEESNIIKPKENQ